MARDLRQALENVVLNGVRHSRGSTVYIVLEQNDGREAVIKVRDDGLGIAREVQPHLFERFVAKGLRRGLGLGLYLAHRFATAHGGNLEVESELGHGTTFTFRLPLGGPPAQRERAAE